MHSVLWLLSVAILWYKRTTSLPKLYYGNHKHLYHDVTETYSGDVKCPFLSQTF